MNHTTKSQKISRCNIVVHFGEIFEKVAGLHCITDLFKIDFPASFLLILPLYHFAIIKAPLQAIGLLLILCGIIAIDEIARLVGYHGNAPRSLSNRLRVLLLN